VTAAGPARAWLPVGAAALGIGALAVSLLLAFTHQRVTLRPIAASSAMSDQQALTVAQSTVRLWAQEVRAGNTTNLQALTCTESPGAADAGQRLARVGKPGTPIEILGFGELTREGLSGWSLPVFFFWPGASDNGKIFLFAVEDGEMRLCDITAPPVLQ
jgi:hypothetical protein